MYKVPGNGAIGKRIGKRLFYTENITESNEGLASTSSALTAFSVECHRLRGRKPSNGTKTTRTKRRGPWSRQWLRDLLASHHFQKLYRFELYREKGKIHITERANIKRNHLRNV